MSRLVLALVWLMAWLLPVAASAQPASRVAVSLHSSSADPAPGRTVMLALRFVPDAGWHGYWSNPGDSGLPPTVAWDVPAGVRIGALQHPAPDLLKVSGLTSFVHGGQHVLLAPMVVPAGYKAGDALPVKGSLDFLICSDSLCVPQKASVALDLTVGKGTADPAARALFAAARRALPKPLSATGELPRRGASLSYASPRPPISTPRARPTFQAGRACSTGPAPSASPTGPSRSAGR